MSKLESWDDFISSWRSTLSRSARWWLIDKSALDVKLSARKLNQCYRRGLRPYWLINRMMRQSDDVYSLFKVRHV